MLAEIAEDEDVYADEIDPRTVPIRFSNLKRMGQSPAHYAWACRFPDRDTLARKLGTFAHALTFGTPEVVVYGEHRAGKVWKAYKAKAERLGQLVASRKEYAAASAMVDALRSDPHAAPLLFDPACQYERQVTWESNGHACTGRIDVIHPRAVIDLKSARTAEPDRFKRQAEWMGYAAQVAWYRDGLDAAGYGLLEPYIIAVESSGPNPVVTFRLTDDAIEFGRRQYRGWLERLIGCIESNQFPGYAQGVVDFDITPPDESPFTLIVDGEETEIP